MTIEKYRQNDADRRRAAAEKEEARRSSHAVPQRGILNGLAASGNEEAKSFLAAQTKKQKKEAEALKLRKERERLQAEEDRLLRLAQVTPAGSSEWRRFAAVRARRVVA